MSSVATLTYQATAVGPVVPANLEAAMAAVDVQDVGLEEITGATATGGSTGVTGATVTRTFTFNIATTEFQKRFPAGTDQACPFRAVYAQRLSGALNCFITEQPVVIA